MSIQRNVRLLAWHNFFTDFRLYAPVAILYFAKVSGSYALGMSIFSVTMLAQAVLEVPTGIFSDLIGRARTVTLGSLAITLGVVCYAIGHNYWWLVAGALLEGLSRSFYSGNNDALLYDTLADENKVPRYADTLGKLSSLFQVAAAIAAVLGSVIAGWSFAWVVWLSVFPQLGCVTVSLLLREPATHTRKIAVNPYAHFKEAWQLFIHNPRLRSLSLANALGQSAGEAVYQFNATFIATLWPVWAIGIAKALSGIGAAISYYTAGRVIKKYSSLTVMIGARIFGRVVSLFAYIFATVFSPLLMALTSLLYGTIQVADSDLKQREYSAGQRATMDSLDSLFTSLMMAVMGVLVGALADATSPVTALIAMQLVQAVPIAFYCRLREKR